MDQAGSDSLPQATLYDTVRAAVTVALPTVAQGVVARRPAMVSLAGKFEADRKVVRLLQQFRDRYGSGPLRLRIPGRSVAVVLSPQDVQRLLDESPEPFALATAEKRGALNQFQPHGSLVSHGSARGERRRFNEEVLDTGKPVHELADDMVAVISQEAQVVLREASRTGELTWKEFEAGWRRCIRRIVLGDSAREDDELSEMLESLRYAANWSYLRPKRTDLRARFGRRLQSYLDEAEPGSLAGAMATASTTGETEPLDQIPQWLFASDPAGMATYRALALLATHPEQRERVRGELDERNLASAQDLPLLRSCVLESVRLWPTTAVILRESTTDTTWGDRTLPAGATLMVVSSFFHRDEQTVPQANRFDPQAWLDGRASANWSVVPFSGGPGTCPGRELVLFLGSTFLAALLEQHDYRLHDPGQLDPERPLPCDLDPFAQRFTVTARAR